MIRGLVLLMLTFFGGVFLLAGARVLLDGDHFFWAFFVLAIGASLVWTAAYFVISFRARRAMAATIDAEAGRTGPLALRYQGEPLAATTELRTFEATISLLMFTGCYETGYLRVGIDRLWPHAVFCSLVTLLFGWWGFPFGPIWSVRTLYRNARGGQRERAYEMLSAEVRDRLKPVDTSPAASLNAWGGEGSTFTYRPGA